MPKYYVFLVLTVFFSTGATYAAAASEQFSRLVPTVLFGLGTIAAYYMFGQASKGLPLSLIYSVWSGMGIVLVAVIGRLFLNEAIDLQKLLGMGLIIAGIVVINMVPNKPVETLPV